MSIRDEIKARLAEQRLFHLGPVLDSDPVVRTMLISEEIRQLLEGPWDSPTIEKRCGRLRSDFELYITGEEVQVCLDPYEHDTALFGRLDRPADEVWDVRSRAPRPGLRVFGRFAEKDVFIALLCAPRSVDQAWLHRKALKDRRSLEWQLCILECQQVWGHLFPNLQPISGGDIRDYISDPVVSV